MMLRSTQFRNLLFGAAIALSSCAPSDTDNSPSAPELSAPSPSQGAASTTEGGNVDMSAQAVTIHKMSAEMVNLMDDVNQKKIMSPPLKVSDVRNAFMDRLDWLPDMTTEDIAKLRQATVDLDALVAEIRAHENAAGDAALEARLKKIEDWNQSIKAGLPQ